MGGLLRMKKFFNLLFVLAVILNVSGTTYYVAKTGNNSNPGTSGSPFLTIQKGVDTARAGDFILIDSGYYAENVRTADFAGSSGSPITINGQRLAVVDSITLENPYINILNFTGITNKTVFGGAIYISQAGSHCIVSNNIIDPNFNPLVTPIIKWNGPDAQPFGTAGSDNLIISNLVQNGMCEMFFRVFGDRNVVSGNTLKNSDFGDWFQVYGRTNYIVNNYCTNLFFSGNNNNHADFFQTFGSAGGSSFGSKGHIIESNIVIHADALAQLGNMTQDANVDCTDITIRNNIFVGIAAKWSITMPNVKVYNNLFYQCATNLENGGAPLIFGDSGPSIGKADGAQCFNNIFIDCGIAGATNTGGTYFAPGLASVASDYNYVVKEGKPVQIDPSHRAVGDVGGWDTTDWWEPHGLNGGYSGVSTTPGFINASQLDFRLAPGSVLIDKALDESALFTTDIRGLTRSSWDIGPYEFQASDSDPGLPCWVGPRTIRAYPLISSGSVQLVWPGNTYRTELKIARRVFNSHPSIWANWTYLYTNNTSGVSGVTNNSSYTDSTIANGVHYEYQISQLITNYICQDLPDYGFRDYQYISTGYQVPLKDTRGKLILLVESGLASSIGSELTTLTNDLIGDGYKVYIHNVAAVDVTSGGWAAAVTATKALIVSDYNTDSSADWTLFIVGHVPIPYSGLNSPGSHTDNFGAHPADSYYADMTGTWTDTTANDVTADGAAQHNVPSDGKFDQSYVPAMPTMRVGRVDLRNMPAFGKTEVQLIQQYLNRNHSWRTKGFTTRNRGLVYGDSDTILLNSAKPIESHNLGASMFGGTTSMDSGQWLDLASSSSQSYLFSAKQGSGHYTQDVQLGTTAAFAASHLYVAFPSMFGSYYGDWDSAMNADVFSQMPLAADGYSVATYYHANSVPLDSSDMDEPIGYELQAMAANYYAGTDARYLPYSRVVPASGEFLIIEQYEQYITLLGDPTLRIRVVSPPSAVTITPSGSDNSISWTASTDTDIQGYHVYRASTSDLNNFTRLTTNPTTSPYTDSGAASGSYKYMVNAVKLNSTANRSLYVASEGILSGTSGGGGGGSSNTRIPGWVNGRFGINGNFRMRR
jgi:hypothetical protein